MNAMGEKHSQRLIFFLGGLPVGRHWPHGGNMSDCQKLGDIAIEI